MWIQRIVHLCVKFLVGYDHACGIELYGLLDEQVAVVVGCEQLYVEHVPVPAYYVQGLYAD